MKRDHSTSEAAQQRISSQMSIEDKKKRAHIVIDNSGRVEDTRQQVNQVIGRITPGWISTGFAWAFLAFPAAIAWVCLTVFKIMKR